MPRVAAVQLDAVVGDVDHNLTECERLADQAALEGAQWIILPEFFSTGMAFDAALAQCSLPPDGAAGRLLVELAIKHSAHVGGSFLCLDPDGEVRNAFFLFSPTGELIGRHDKDLPTMWENCFYVGGGDAGRFDYPEGEVGVAMCWELIRAQTAERLRGRVDVVVGGSCWWSIPEWPPKGLTARMEARNAANATSAAATFARMTGAPAVHAAHCGPIDCRMPWAPLGYHGFAEGGAAIFAADGSTLAYRSREEGSGSAIADVNFARETPAEPIPAEYWLCKRGLIPELAWKYQRAHGRRWYRKNVKQRQTDERPGAA